MDHPQQVRPLRSPLPGRDPQRRFRPVRARVLGAALLGVLVTCELAGPSRASAEPEDRILLLAKSAIYGAVTGLILGGVTALVVDSDSRDDAVRWGIVLGAFGGFAYGIYTISRGEDDLFFRPLPGSPPADPSRRAFGAMARPTAAGAQRLEASPFGRAWGRQMPGLEFKSLPDGVPDPRPADPSSGPGAEPR
jgi:hypothetical protein